MLNSATTLDQGIRTNRVCDFPYRRLHFIGIGGVGMSAVALGALRSGISVSGSDLAANSYTEALKAHGARISIGHDAANIGEADGLVVSSAIQQENLELREARERGISVLHRSEVLAALVGSRECICVAGSHGKTTTTAMIGRVLEACGFDPSVYVAGL